MDPRIRIHTKMSWIRNKVSKLQEQDLDPHLEFSLQMSDSSLKYYKINKNSAIFKALPRFFEE